MMLRRRPSRLVAVAAVAVGGLVMAACGSGPSTIETSAVFSNVSSLTTGASVQLADIDVGSVTGIHLHGDKALVTMALQRSARVPADVTAELTQTTVLGQYVVALVPRGHGTRLLRNGQAITHSQDVPGIQQLVQTGTEAFGAIDAGQLSSLIDNSAQGIGGEGQRIHTLLDDFGTVLAGYASQAHDITTLVNAMNSFAAGLAPDAQANAQALANLTQTTSTLAQQSGHFVSLLQALDALATQGRSILDTGLPQVETQIHTLGAIAQQLQAHQQQLATLLQEVPRANRGLARTTYHHYLQVLNNFIVCGVPGLGEGTAPTNTCSPSGGGS